HALELVHLAMPVEVVEAAHFVRAVVGAVPRTDAAVVGHVVEAFGAVLGRSHRTDVLAGRFLAVLASDRLIDNARIAGVVTREVTVQADPVHLATALHFELADSRDVVFGLTSDHARAAAGARREIDDETPLVAPHRSQALELGRLFGRARGLVLELA